MLNRMATLPWSRRGVLVAALAAVPAGSAVLWFVGGARPVDYVAPTIIFAIPVVVALLASDTRRAGLVAGIAAGVLLVPSVLGLLFGTFVYLPAVALLAVAARRRDGRDGRPAPVEPAQP